MLCPFCAKKFSPHEIDWHTIQCASYLLRYAENHIYKLENRIRKLEKKLREQEIQPTELVNKEIMMLAFEIHDRRGPRHVENFRQGILDTTGRDCNCIYLAHLEIADRLLKAEEKTPPTRIFSLAE